MPVSHAVADAFNAYRSGPFGYNAIDMNARWVNNGTDFLPAGSLFIPGVYSRNNEQWNQVEVDETEYIYDSSKMLFPLPRHHLNYVTIEIESQFEGLFRIPAENNAVIIAFEFCTKENGEWVSKIRRYYTVGILTTSEPRKFMRLSPFCKIFHNWTTGYDTEQWVIKPSITYPGGEFRIDRAFCRVYLHANSAT